MTRPSPSPRPKPAKLGVEKPAPKTQVTYSGLTFVRSETPIAFEAALAVKTGVGMVTGPESDEVSK